MSPADTVTLSGKEFSDLETDRGELSYNGFKIIRFKRAGQEQRHGIRLTTEWAVLKRGNEVLATFGDSESAHSEVGFSLPSLLGGESKQLLVEHGSPNGGRHWVVDLSSNPFILFDSYDWRIRSEDASISDKDTNGAYRIQLELTAFQGFAEMSPSEETLLRIHMPIDFRYDASLREYVPADPALPRYLADYIDVEADQISPGETERTARRNFYLGKRLHFFLRYVYSGRRDDGWAFFERTYGHPDKAEITAMILERLENDPVYKYIYDRKTKHKVVAD